MKHSSTVYVEIGWTVPACSTNDDGAASPSCFWPAYLPKMSSKTVSACFSASCEWIQSSRGRAMLFGSSRTLAQSVLCHLSLVVSPVFWTAFTRSYLVSGGQPGPCVQQAQSCNEPDFLVRLERRLHTLFSPPAQTHGQRRAILHGLRRALRTGRQERVRRVAEQQDAAPLADPGGQRVAVDELPVDEGGRLFDNGAAQGVPAVEDGEHVVELAGKGPRLVNVVLVLVRQHPAAVGAVLDGREQKVHVGPDPAVEGVAVGAEVARAWVLDHVGVGEPVPGCL